MANGNCVYKVCIYTGNMESRESRCIYTTSKQSKAEAYLHSYLREHPEVCKAYIEREFTRQSMRDRKSRYYEDEND